MMLIVVLASCTLTSQDEMPSSSTATAPNADFLVVEGVAQDGIVASEPWRPPEDFSLRFLALVNGVAPHDGTVETQSLAFRGGIFYTSVGGYGDSAVHVTNATTGERIDSVSLDEEYASAGITVVADQVVQLTVSEETAFIWDAYTLDPLGTFSYEGEGRGLCVQQDHFVMSDGTSTLTLRDLGTFDVFDTIKVRHLGQPVDMIEELACTTSWIHASVADSGEILVIDPGTGFVIGRIIEGNMSDFLEPGKDLSQMTGFAVNARTGDYYITGRAWDSVLEVRITLG